MAHSGDSFTAALLTWFAAHGRHDLPWQLDRDPYRIWVSEIMLQQTQVATVIPYFQRFIERFPDVATLAGARLDDVLAHWSGLGYYARARNLHKAGAEVRDRHDGELPRALESLTALPGIGRSTAAAILALAWNESHAILDGNVKRVLARYHAVSGWPGKAEVLARLWSLAEQHTPAERAAEYTQAIMDLGATLCTRTKPRCGECPVAAHCGALAAGTVAELPTPRPKHAKPRRSVTVVLIHTGHGDLLLERRPPAGIWGGLLSLPEIPDAEATGPAPAESKRPHSTGPDPAGAGTTAGAATGADAGHTAAHGPADWCRDTFGVVVERTRGLEPIEHSFTHFDLTLEPIAIRVAGPARDAACGTVDGAAAVLETDRWLWYNTARPLPGGMAAPIEKLIRTLWPAGGVGSDGGAGDRVDSNGAVGPAGRAGRKRRPTDAKEQAA